MTILAADVSERGVDRYAAAVRGQYWIETLGCAKNEVDSDHIAGGLIAEGYVAARSAEDADLVVVNTCAFIESARAESVDAILDLGHRQRDAVDRD